MIGIFVAVFLFSILAGAGYYIAYRIYQGLSCFFAGIRFLPVALVAATLALMLIIGFGRSFIPFPKEINHALGWIGGYSMGIFLYLFLSTVLVDLLLLIPKLINLPFTNHSLCKGFATLSVLLITAVVCIFGFINGGRIKHVSYDIQLKDKTDVSDLNVVMISDLHLGSIGSEARLKEIVDEINGLNPDLVCISGDFFDTDFSSIRDPETAVNTLKGIRSTFGTYACLGNHDGGKTHGEMVDFLDNANIQLLSDEYTIIDNRLVLVGRLDKSPIGGYGEKHRKDLSEFFDITDSSLPVIVLDHNPANIKDYGSEADLILCGHTHKGQVFPGSLITNAIYDVDYGYYQKDSDSPHVIVTSGVGSWGMPMRVGTNVEIVSVRLT